MKLRVRSLVVRSINQPRFSYTALFPDACVTCWLKRVSRRKDKKKTNVPRNLSVDIENSVKLKRACGCHSHCNGRIKVSTLRYLETFQPAGRIRLIYFFPLVCHLPGWEYFANGFGVKIKVKPRETRVHACVGMFGHLPLKFDNARDAYRWSWKR